MPGWAKGCNRLLRSDPTALLFEDASDRRSACRSEYRGQMACLILYFANKTPAVVSSFHDAATLTRPGKGKPAGRQDVYRPPR